MALQTTPEGAGAAGASAAPIDAAAPQPALDSAALEAQKAAAAADAAKDAGHGQELTVWYMFSIAHPIVQGVMVILVLMSIAALALLFEKVYVFRKNNRLVKGFRDQFRKAKSPEEAAELLAKQPKGPLKTLFDAGMGEVAKTKEMGLYLLRDARDHTLERVRSAMTIKQNEVTEELSAMMTFLASVGSNAPFIGLFGTVFGIMNSFIGIVKTQTTSLVSVAPGIAEALLATAIGLAAAIPAVMIYNYSARQISRISGAMEDFTSEFLSLVSRDMDKKGA